MGGSGIKAVVRAVEAAIASTNVGIEIRDELDAAVAAEIEAAATVATVGAIVKTATSAIAVESVAVDVMSVTAVAISITEKNAASGRSETGTAETTSHAPISFSHLRTVPRRARDEASMHAAIGSRPR